MKYIRLSALVLSGALTLSLLAACGGKDTDATPTPEATDPPAVTESLTPSPEPSETPAAGTQTPDTNAPAATDKPAETQKPSVTQKPSAAPDSGAAQNVSVSTIWDKVSAELELPGLMDLDDDLLSSLYGISAADLEEYVAKTPMMNVQSTEFFIAKVKAGKMDTVKAGIAKRQADLVAQWKQYLPAQLELVENYKLVTSGDYVMFAIADGVDSAVTAFNSCTK
ncbi:MAG: DUF4358 domain-containing protein [Oscillospiraceae bacterium]|jgi:cytoskeletal protein RodZ